MDLTARQDSRAIGASNVNLEQVREYQVYGVLDAVQLRYSMLDRLIERAAARPAARTGSQ